MTTATFAGKTIEFDNEGFMTDHLAWSKELCMEIAQTLGIELTDTHWKLIDFARDDFEVKHTSPGLRRITKNTGVGMKDIYKLFPKGPGKLIAKCAGLPKPKSCL